MGVDSFLEEASQLGCLDSEGSFTIAGQEAVGKLASFQLPRPSAWILKMVQAAVTSGASELCVKQSADVTTFRFDPTKLVEVDDLQQALLSPDMQAPDFLKHLAIGLRTVGFGDGRAFTMAVGREDRRELFGWDGQQLSRQSHQVETPTAAYIHIGVAFPQENRGRALGGLMRAAGRATDEYGELVKFGQACPIRLTFDGRRLDTLSNFPEKLVKCTTVPLAIGCCQPGALHDMPSLRIPRGVHRGQEKWRPTDRFTDSRLFFFDGGAEQWETQVLSRLCYHFHIDNHRSKYRSFKFHNIKQPSYCHWVKDGVICQSTTISRTPAAVSLDLFLSAEGLSTDISGLRLRDVADAPARVREALALAPGFMDRTETVLENYTPRPFGIHTALYGGLGLMGVAAAPLTFGKGMMATVAAVGMAVSAYDKRKIMLDCTLSLRHVKRQALNMGIR